MTCAGHVAAMFAAHFAALASAHRQGLGRTKPCDLEGRLGGALGAVWRLPHARSTLIARCVACTHGSVVRGGVRREPKYVSLGTQQTTLAIFCLGRTQPGFHLGES